MVESGDGEPGVGLAPQPVGESDWGAADWPLGARVADGAVTFAVYSRNATVVMLEIFDRATGADAVFACRMQKNPGDDIWRARLSGVPDGTAYGFRCWGPN